MPEGQLEGKSWSLEEEFRYHLPVRNPVYPMTRAHSCPNNQEMYPVLFEMCPIVLRVRSALLAKDGNNLIAWFHQRGMFIFTAFNPSF